MKAYRTRKERTGLLQSNVDERRNKIGPSNTIMERQRLKEKDHKMMRYQQDDREIDTE